MKKLLILLSIAFASSQLVAQEREERDSITRLILQKAVDFYFNEPQNQIDSHKIVVLSSLFCYDYFEKKQLHYKGITVLIVPSVDSACAFFKKEINEFVSLDFDKRRTETVLHGYIWISKLELNCENTPSLTREEKAKIYIKGSRSVFTFNKNRTKIASESHRFN